MTVGEAECARDYLDREGLKDLDPAWDSLPLRWWDTPEEFKASEYAEPFLRRFGWTRRLGPAGKSMSGARRRTGRLAYRHRRPQGRGTASERLGRMDYIERRAKRLEPTTGIVCATWFDESAPAFRRVVNRRDVCLPVGLADCFQCGENGS